MISPLTPWTAIGPDHYLRASQQGFEQGAAIATAQNRTKELAAQRALQQSELDQREQLARWEMGQRQQQAASELRAREQDTAATLALRREYEMGRLADADAAAKDRSWRMKQPSLHTVAGQGLVSVDPTTGKSTVVMEEKERPGNSGVQHPFVRLVEAQKKALDAGDPITAKIYGDYASHLTRDSSLGSRRTYLQNKATASRAEVARAKVGDDSAITRSNEAALKVYEDELLKLDNPAGAGTVPPPAVGTEEDEELAPEAPPTAAKATTPGFLQRAFTGLTETIPSMLGSWSTGQGPIPTSPPSAAAQASEWPAQEGAFPLLPQGGTNAPTTDVDGLIRENQAAVAGAQAQRAEAQKTLQDVQGKAKRVRVTGPGGKKGTVEQGDTLPEGWKLAE
jgi:hypothetical protein